MSNGPSQVGSMRAEILFLAILVSALALLFAFSLTLDAAARELWLKEGGIVESLSAAGYFVCAFLMLYRGGLRYVRQYHYFFLMVLLFGLRELDFDKRFTSMGLLKARLYTSSDAPAFEKLIGLLLIALLLYLAVTIVRRHYRRFIYGVRSLSPIHVNALLIVVFLVVSKTLDGIARKLGAFGVAIAQDLSAHLATLEEILELGVPILILFVIHQYFSGRAGDDAARG